MVLQWSVVGYILLLIEIPALENSRGVLDDSGCSCMVPANSR